MTVERPYDIISFDCYGTLIDWDAGIVAAFQQAAGGTAHDFAALVAGYHAAEPRMQAGTYRPYREVLAGAARAAAMATGWEMSEAIAAAFAASLPRWPPFPDTVPALARLHAAGYRLAILSNVDDDLLAGTLRQLPVPFAFVITAQQTGSYKPAPGHFLAARAAIGPARWLHAAQSLFHDVVPAGALEIPVAWVNRKGEPAGGARPAIEVASLAELAALLT